MPIPFLPGSFLRGDDAAVARCDLVGSWLGIRAARSRRAGDSSADVSPKAGHGHGALRYGGDFGPPSARDALGGYIVDHYHWSWISSSTRPSVCWGCSWWRPSFTRTPKSVNTTGSWLSPSKAQAFDWSASRWMWIGPGARYRKREPKTTGSTYAITGVFARHCPHRVAPTAEPTAPYLAVDLRLFKDPVFGNRHRWLAAPDVCWALMATMFLLPIFSAGTAWLRRCNGFAAHAARHR